MEIKNDNKTIITGRKICMAVGMLSAICGIYWLVKALFYDEAELEPMLLSFAISLLLTVYAQKH